MVAVVVIFCASILSVFVWLLVRSSPGLLARLLPARLTFIFGCGLFVTAFFSAFIAAHVLGNPELMLHCFVQGYVGLWLMLATSANARGTETDDRFLRRLFAMIGLVIGGLIAMLYVRDPQLTALLNLVLMTGGFWLVTNYLHQLDRGR